MSRSQSVASLFQKDTERVENSTYRLGNLYIDFSKTHLDHFSIQKCVAKANTNNFDNWKRGLFSGEKINVTEGRSVLHTLMRQTDHSNIELVSDVLSKAAQDAKISFSSFVNEIREQFINVDSPVRDIIHIGIGGSSLGPQLLFESLAAINQKIRIHFIDNIDAHQILAALIACDPKTTLVFGVSKTFSTQETLVNLETVQAWFNEHGTVQFDDHFYAITANKSNAQRFGALENRILEFPEWVGGRYSVWSSVSLSVAVIIGWNKFEEFLEGGALVDREFLNTEISMNPAFIAAALDYTYVNEFSADSKATFAYDYRLRSLVPYLQQLETESNGKDRDINGNPVNCKTSPIVWGGTGTGMQHSTFQLLHQGTHCIPVEFILVKQPSHGLTNHHTKLLSNGLAQSAALLKGRTYEQVLQISDDDGTSEVTQKSKIFSGNRPSTTIVMSELSPSSLGQLIAFYEHRTFCAGVLSNINSFDQMGVELGKELATSIEDILEDTGDDTSTVSRYDPSTNQLIKEVSTL